MHEQTRIRLYASIGASVCIGLAAAGQSFAQSSGSTLAACAAIETESERLACFDRLTRGEPGNSGHRRDGAELSRAAGVLHRVAYA